MTKISFPEWSRKWRGRRELLHWRSEPGFVTKLERVSDLLRTASTLVLSTTARDGSPRATPLFYIPGEELRVYWLSSPSSDHSRNLKRNPAAAIAIYMPTDEWRQIRGVQMRGRALPVIDRPLRRAIIRAYVEGFRLGTVLGDLITRSRLYEFRPEWLRYIDNSIRFGYKFEWALKTK